MHIHVRLARLRTTMRAFHRLLSTCATRFEPLADTYKTLRHIHFDGITPFAKGQEIQASMVSANLDFKKMEAKIRRQQKDFAASGMVLQDYEQAFIKRVLGMKPAPVVLTFEFENVYTGGKQMRHDPALAEKIALFQQQGCAYHQLERGGQVTWHGAGQLTAYVILDLKQFSNLTVRCYVDSVLLAAVQALLRKNYGIEGVLNGQPGVWVDKDRKICLVGCNIQRAVTLYGVGLNVNPDLSFLNSHVMCGLPDSTATSVAELVPGCKDTVKDVGAEFAKEIARRLNINTVEHVNGTELASAAERAAEQGTAP